MATNDLALLARWTRDRDPEAFAEVARRHAGMVYGACRRILGNPTDAEDAAQECFLVLAQTGAPPKSNLGAWLHRVAVNKACDRARSDHQRRDRERRYASTHRTASEVEWHDVESYVDEAIAALPDEFRESLVAHFMEGHSHAEIAERLGVSRQTVTYRVNKGVESIRETLRKRGLQIAVPSLFFGLTANMAEAAPPALVAAIGKLAVSGVPVASAGITIAGLLTLKNALIAASVVAVIVVSAALIQHTPHNRAAVPPNTPAIASQPTQSASIDGTTQNDSSTTVPATSNRADLVNDWRVLTGVVVDASGVPVHRERNKYGNVVGNSACVNSYSVIAQVSQSLGTMPVNDDGTFLIEKHKPRTRGEVYANKWDEDLISDFVEFSLTPDGVHNVTLRLLPGARVSGTFLDADNAPVPGTTISAHLENSLFELGAPVDSFGQFDIGPLPPGKFKLTPCSRSNELGSLFGLPDAVIELSRGQRLTGIKLVFNKRRSVVAGRVVDSAGRSVPDMLVSASTVSSEISALSGDFGTITATTDTQGRFEIPAYVPQTFELSVQRVGESFGQAMRLAEERVQAEAGDRNVVLTLADFNIVRGMCTAPTPENL